MRWILFLFSKSLITPNANFPGTFRNKVLGNLFNKEQLALFGTVPSTVWRQSRMLPIEMQQCTAVYWHGGNSPSAHLSNQPLKALSNREMLLCMFLSLRTYNVSSFYFLIYSCLNVKFNIWLQICTATKSKAAHFCLCWLKIQSMLTFVHMWHMKCGGESWVIWKITKGCHCLKRFEKRSSVWRRLLEGLEEVMQW